MTVENQNFSLYRGDTKNIYITVEDEDNGGYFDLTGSSIICSIYDPNTDEILLTKTTASGITIDDPASGGILIIHLLPEDTANFEPANYYFFEVEVTDAFDQIITVTTGYVHVKKSKVGT